MLPSKKKPSNNMAGGGLLGAEGGRPTRPSTGATGNLTSALSASMDSIAKQHMDSSFMEEDGHFTGYDTDNRGQTFNMEMDSRSVERYR